MLNGGRNDMTEAPPNCDACGKPGATVTVYSGGRMSHYHAECRPEKENSACAERHQWSVDQWLFRE
jgi:hypothetical protein